MLIVRSPLRISLAGGGTDLPSYYKKYGGAVINTSIDRYFYVFLRTFSSNGLEISSADFRTFFRYDGGVPFSWEGDLKLPRSIFHHFGIFNGLSLFLASEIPPGTGLGSSSSVSVGLIKALTTACGLNWSRQDIAELASYIEISKLKSPIGKQDQYAAAFGGLNQIDFNSDNTQVTPLTLSSDNLIKLEHSLMLFYTGQNRNANEILSRQNEATQKKSGSTLEALHRVKSMVPEVRKCLEAADLKSFGNLLNENWEEKKRFTKGVSNTFVDECYDLAIRNGAWGGKLTGAGGGGFLLLCCDERFKNRVSRELVSKGLNRIDFHLEGLGARVLMNSGLRLASKIAWEKPDQLREKI